MVEVKSVEAIQLGKRGGNKVTFQAESPAEKIKRGIISANYDFSAAVDLFNNVINIALFLIANKISSKVSETSLF